MRPKARVFHSFVPFIITQLQVISTLYCKLTSIFQHLGDFHCNGNTHTCVFE